jgi:8-oxo-dGTP pyrophosphatase MutT (NUDIX family)
MYKIHINNIPLTIVSGKDGEDYNKAMKQGSLVAPFPGKKKFLLHYIDLLEKNVDHPGVVLVASDIDDAIQVMESLFEPIKAAGGLVYNPDGKLLFIKRRGVWDLPKGKIEEGETIKEAALREVEEETNLSDLDIVEELPVTRHTYKEKSTRLLKRTYWYKMSSEGKNAAPEIEEDITEVRWMDPENFLQEDYDTYRTLIELLKEELLKVEGS